MRASGKDFLPSPPPPAFGSCHVGMWYLELQQPCWDHEQMKLWKNRDTKTKCWLYWTATLINPVSGLLVMWEDKCPLVKLLLLSILLTVSENNWYGNCCLLGIVLHLHNIHDNSMQYIFLLSLFLYMSKPKFRNVKCFAQKHCKEHTCLHIFW